LIIDGDVESNPGPTLPITAPTAATITAAAITMIRHPDLLTVVAQSAIIVQLLRLDTAAVQSVEFIVLEIVSDTFTPAAGPNDKQSPIIDSLFSRMSPTKLNYAARAFFISSSLAGLGLKALLKRSVVAPLVDHLSASDTETFVATFVELVVSAIEYRRSVALGLPPPEYDSPAVKLMREFEDLARQQVTPMGGSGTLTQLEFASASSALLHASEAWLDRSKDSALRSTIIRMRADLISRTSELTHRHVPVGPPIVFTFCGRPGSGKSTLAKLLCTVLLQTQGFNPSTQICHVDPDSRFDDTQTSATVAAVYDEPFKFSPNNSQALAAAIAKFFTLSGGTGEALKKADLDSKGRHFSNLMVLMATANLSNPTAIGTLVSDSALRRRMGVRVEVVVKKPYLMPNGMIDYDLALTTLRECGLSLAVPKIWSLSCSRYNVSSEQWDDLHWPVEHFVSRACALFTKRCATGVAEVAMPTPKLCPCGCFGLDICVAPAGQFHPTAGPSSSILLRAALGAGLVRTTNPLVLTCAMHLVARASLIHGAFPASCVLLASSLFSTGLSATTIAVGLPTLALFLAKSSLDWLGVGYNDPVAADHVQFWRGGGDAGQALARIVRAIAWRTVKAWASDYRSWIIMCGVAAVAATVVTPTTIVAPAYLPAGDIPPSTVARAPAAWVRPNLLRVLALACSVSALLPQP